MPTHRPISTGSPITALGARRLLMNGLGLLDDPNRRATTAGVRKMVERLGFVQVDTIAVSERAHHHILLTRFHDYSPATLTRLLERDRALFEHWTHDASIIPVSWLPWWRVRFERYRRRGHAPNGWWRDRMGNRAQEIIAAVLRKVEIEGPLRVADVGEKDEKGRKGSEPWWGWRPEKAALEYLWRTGELSIARRINFHKVYDLTERVFPGAFDAPVPSDDAHVEWACLAALERLGCASPGEIAAFKHAISPAEARRWCEHAERDGRIAKVLVERSDKGKPTSAYALPARLARLNRLPDPPREARVLSPFDPLIRDRKRALRLFGLDYRFEAFVPAPKRRHGYYTMPILDGDRFIARIDPKLHRDRGELELLGAWWDIKSTPKLRAKAKDAIERYAHQVGATRVVGKKFH